MAAQPPAATQSDHITQRTDYPYLGMHHNEILRKQSAARVAQYKLEILGWETALSAAKKFSNGKVCSIGQGSGLGLSRQPQVQGTFNLCFWIQVEGESRQWVVRFPLKGITSDDTTLARMRSEIATMQFLHQYTKVPVPGVIGYNENENDFPLFMILESVEGIRMSAFLAIDVPPHLLDRVFKDLSRIHLELLSHPSDRIGMLDLSQLPNSPTPTLGPYSLDAIEHERDGVHTLKSEPLTSSRKYYEYKCRLVSGNSA